MAEFETTWELENGKVIELGIDYIGDKAWQCDPENYHNNELSVTVDGNTEVFEVWGSMRNPEFTSEYDLKNAFSMVCGEALDVIWDETDHIITENMSLSEVRELIDALEDNADKLTGSLDLTEDELLEIVNNENWH